MRVPGEDGADSVEGEGTASELMYSGVRGWTGYEVSCAITLGVSTAQDQWMQAISCSRDALTASDSGLDPSARAIDSSPGEIPCAPSNCRGQ